MTREPRSCREIEPDLIAVATAEAPPAAARRVESHVAECASCRSELAQYQTVDGLVTAYRDTRAPEADPTLARAQLESRLADLRSRIMRYGVFDSPLGPIAIGVSEHGVSMVEYVRPAELAGGGVARRAGEKRWRTRAGRKGSIASWPTISTGGARGWTGRSISGGPGATSSGASSRPPRVFPMGR